MISYVDIQLDTNKGITYSLSNNLKPVFTRLNGVYGWELVQADDNGFQQESIVNFKEKRRRMTMSNATQTLPGTL